MRVIERAGSASLSAVAVAVENSSSSSLLTHPLELQESLTYYNAVLHIMSSGARTRVAWTIDLLPDDKAAAVEAMQAKGRAVMKKTLKRTV